MEKSESESVTGVNQVDTSPEKVNQEWDEIATDEKLAEVSDIEIGPGDAMQDGHSRDEPDRDKSIENLSLFLWRILKLVFSKLTPTWHVDESESEKLSGAWSAVICKWLPGAWLRFIPGGGAVIELDAIMVTIEVFEPRWGKTRKSGSVQNVVSEQAAPAGALSKNDISGKSGKQPETQSETMPEVHDVEAGK